MQITQTFGDRLASPRVEKRKGGREGGFSLEPVCSLPFLENTEKSGPEGTGYLPKDTQPAKSSHSPTDLRPQHLLGASPCAGCGNSRHFRLCVCISLVLFLDVLSYRVSSAGHMKACGI